MFQQDYILRIIEQLTEFIKKALQLDINEDPEEFVFLFEEFQNKPFHKLIEENEDLLIHLEKLNLNTETKDYLALTFYKAALVFNKKEEKQKAKKYFRIAEQVDDFQVQTVVFAANNREKKELELYRTQAKNIF